MSRTSVVLVLILLACQGFAATPVAAISCNQSVVISGITVPADRVISWPVSINDEIVTQSAPAMLRFNDGTVVTLQRNSRMKLTAGHSGVEVKMLAGSAIYDIKPRSTVSIGDQVAPSSAVSSREIPSTPVVTPFPVRGSAASNAAVASALAQAPSPSSGIALAPAETSLATFSAAPRARTLPSDSLVNTITLANGTIIECHLVSGGGNTGQPSVLTIDRIIFAVADPSRPGDTIYLTPPKGFANPLIGASITVPAGLTPLVGINLPVTLLNGTPLTPAQLADLLQQTANAAFNDPNNLFLPGQTPPTPQFPSPVTNGQLSGKST